MSLGTLKGPVPFPESRELMMFITSSGSADSKMKFELTRSGMYSEKCLVPGVCLGRSFSAIEEK